MLKNLRRFLRRGQFNLRGIFISTYIPRHCGIATYTKDLTNAINKLSPNHLSQIVALDDEREPVDYPWEVKFKINKENLEDYEKAAKFINASSCDYVGLQHEYGIFGGQAGDYILNLLAKIKKPLVTTFHTTVNDPSPQQKKVLKEIALKSKACVVMVPEAARRLSKIYKIPQKKIITIPHGVPDIPFSPSYLFKENVGFSKDTFLIGSINLVAPNKGLEYVIAALPEIRKIIPQVKFVMIGQTHPLVAVSEDESYRNFLLSQVKKLNVEENFVEINEYISLDQLISYLKALDIYITPYTDMNQTSSGTLAYALGAGKVCLSTPYIYAKESLSKNRGIIIKARSAASIAQAVIEVCQNHSLRKEIEENAYDYGRHMIWERVALDSLNLYKFILNV